MRWWKNVWDSYWARVVAGSLALFGLLPLLVGVVWKFPDGYALGVYIGTGVAVLWYTVETSYVRREMARQNDIAIRPVIAIILDESRGAPAFKLKNVGRGTALYVHANDIVKPGSVEFRLVFRLDTVDVLEPSSEANVTPTFRLLTQEDGHTQRREDATRNFLPKTARETFPVTILYEDTGGGKHESVMQMGKGGIRLLKHR